MVPLSLFKYGKVKKFPKVKKKKLIYEKFNVDFNSKKSFMFLMFPKLILLKINLKISKLVFH